MLFIDSSHVAVLIVRNQSLFPPIPRLSFALASPWQRGGLHPVVSLGFHPVCCGPSELSLESHGISYLFGQIANARVYAGAHARNRVTLSSLGASSLSADQCSRADTGLSRSSACRNSLKGVPVLALHHGRSLLGFVKSSDHRCSTWLPRGL